MGAAPRGRGAARGHAIVKPPLRHPPQRAQCTAEQAPIRPRTPFPSFWAISYLRTMCFSTSSLDEDDCTRHSTGSKQCNAHARVNKRGAGETGVAWPKNKPHSLVTGWVRVGPHPHEGTAATVHRTPPHHHKARRRFTGPADRPAGEAGLPCGESKRSPTHTPQLP